MQDLPISIDILFAVTTIAACIFFYRAATKNTAFAIVAGLWLLVQAGVALTGFYTVTHTFPPRFVVLIGVPLLCILCLFVFRKGREYIDRLDMKYLILIHTVRIPVEIVLYLLYLHKKVPVGMTFEGSNYDILSGISAIVIFWLYKKDRIGKAGLLLWNVICLLLLVNIVVTAVLSAPLAFQQFAFDQPNIAVLYFPYVWLPCCVVPLVLLSHLAAMRKLIMNR